MLVVAAHQLPDWLLAKLGALSLGITLRGRFLAAQSKEKEGGSFGLSAY
jgi:hypothetical protein